MSDRELITANMTLTAGIRKVMREFPEEDRAFAIQDIVDQIKARSEPIQAGARLQYIRSLLSKEGASNELIAIARDADLTRRFNEFQMNRLREKSGVERAIPVIFARPNVLSRLSKCDINKKPTYQEIADIILAGSLRPSELGSLRITIAPCGTARACGYAKGRDPTETREFISLVPVERFVELLNWVRKHYANWPSLTRSLRRWLQHTHGLLTKDLRAIGSQYIAEHYARNHTQRALVQRLALRHKPEDVASEHYGTFTSAPISVQ